MYGRGRGVHSPRAFALVHSLLRPYATYYDFDLHPSLFDADLARLVYRIVARCGIKSLVGKEIDTSLVEVPQLASSTLSVVDRGESAPSPRLFMIHKPMDMGRLALSDGDMVLLLAPLRYDALRNWIDGLNHVIIMDLYEAILIVYMPNVKYLYRTTM